MAESYKTAVVRAIRECVKMGSCSSTLSRTHERDVF